MCSMVIEGKVLKVNFSDNRVDNNQLVVTVEAICKLHNNQQLDDLLLIKGEVSLPVLSVINHNFSRVVKYLGIYDTKLKGFVITVTNGNKYRIGNLVDHNGDFIVYDLFDGYFLDSSNNPCHLILRDLGHCFKLLERKQDNKEVIKFVTSDCYNLGSTDVFTLFQMWITKEKLVEIPKAYYNKLLLKQ